LPYVALVLFVREIVMKIWKILVGAVFIFLTPQCQAAESSSDDESFWKDTEISFLGVWSGIKALKNSVVYNKDFYHDYFLESARELYTVDQPVFSVTGGDKTWIDMTLTPVLVDALFGTGTINEDFPWLKEQDFTHQIIGYLGWLKDTDLEAKYTKIALNDLKDILKGGDTVNEGARLEKVQIIGTAMMKIADWTAATKSFSSAQEILNHFTSEYGVGESTGDTKRHRFILAFNSSIAYMNPKDTLFDLNSFQTLRDLVVDSELQAYIPEDFYTSLEGKYLVR
jgi:hypothetical protein